MSAYLVDTNVLSELRRPRRSPQVLQWFSATNPDNLFISVLTLGEFRRGIEQLRGKDPAGAAALDRWLAGMRKDFEERVLPIDQAVAETWGKLCTKQPLPSIDGLLAATAMVHHLTVATRNTADFERTGVPCLNPFEPTP